MKILKFPEKTGKGKRLYKCSTCKKPFQWAKNSWWYGSYYETEEQPEKLKFYCTTKCKNKSEIKE